MSKNYGERSENISCNYGGTARIQNATVNPRELQDGLREQKKQVAKRVAEHQEYKRVPKGKTSKTQMLPAEERYGRNGSITLVKPVTTTTRENH